MKKVISMLVLGVVIFSTAILGGCGKSSSDPTVSKTQTAYAVVNDLSADGQKQVVNYLTDQNTNVQKIKETVEGYVKGYTTIDYKTTDGMETYGYVNDGMLKEFKDKNDAAETVKTYKENALAQQFNGLKIDTIKVAKDMNLAEIKGSFTFKLIEGKDTFLKQNNLQKGSLYQQDYTIQVVKQNDVWKVSYNKIGEVTPVSK